MLDAQHSRRLSAFGPPAPHTVSRSQTSAGLMCSNLRAHIRPFAARRARHLAATLATTNVNTLPFGQSLGAPPKRV